MEFFIVFVPLFAFLALYIWRPASSSRPGNSTADRIAWTIFVLGICLMVSLALYAMASEDGSYRPWQLIRFHTRLFVVFAAIALAGPLFGFLYQRVPFAARPVPKKPMVDDLD